MDILVERGCGLDVHQATVVACLLVGAPGSRARKDIKTFSSTTGGLRALRDWLRQERCTHVAMESTGVYWVPVYRILEQENEFDITGANARHVRALPGRKTDVKDSEWIAQLLRHGLLSKSFVPPPAIRDLRVLTRYRKSLIEDRTAGRNRVLKLLETANIKLSSVASNVFGVSGMLMLKALASGTTAAESLAGLARGRLKNKLRDLEAALEGAFSDEHRFILQVMLDRLADLERELAKIDARLEEKLVPYASQMALLDEIPGVNRNVAAAIIAELGVEMSVFQTAKRCAAWAGVCPGNNESGGRQLSNARRKGNPHLITMLVQAAHAAVNQKGSYLRSKYGRLKGRRGAKRAALAIAHKILISAFHILARGVGYVDLGETYLDQLHQHRIANQLTKRLNALGFNVILEKNSGTEEVATA